MYKVISDSPENRKIMNYIALSITLNNLICIIKHWMGSVDARKHQQIRKIYTDYNISV